MAAKPGSAVIAYLTTAEKRKFKRWAREEGRSESNLAGKLLREAMARRP